MSLLLFAVCFAHHAQAADNPSTKGSGLYLEPGAVYEFKGNGSINGNFAGGANLLSGNETGPGGTLRVGANVYKIFFAGLEGLYLRDTQDTRLGNFTGNEYGGGVFAGVQMPWVVGLRVWGGYLPWVVDDFDKTNGFRPHFSDGRGWKVGAGFRVSIVSINVEYMRLNFHSASVDIDGGSSVGSSSDITHKQDAWLAGISFPLTL
jgi:hypothetical protein